VIAVFALIVAGALLIWGSTFTLLRASSSHGEKVGAFVFYISVVDLLLGIVSLIVAWSLMKGKYWARLSVIALSLVSIFVSILSLSYSNFGSVITIFVYGYIAYLMMTRSVKVFLSNN
jgi:hypothetical protein